MLSHAFTADQGLFSPFASRSPRKNQTLEDYQMQLMFLEIQNKQRLQRAAMDQMKSSVEEEGGESGFLKAESSSRDADQPLQSIIVANSLQEDQRLEADLKNVLDVADPSQLDLKKLQGYIESLQAQAKQLESMRKKEAPCRYQVIYRIKKSEYAQQHNAKGKYQERYTSFFDHPEWVYGQGTAVYIRSNLPLTNLDLYLEKNKDISFIVYRNFDRDSTATPAEPRTGNIDDAKFADLPQQESETIRPVNDDLVAATKALLNSRPEYAGLKNQFSASLELPAPYLCVYHSRERLASFQESLPPKAKAQLLVLLRYVTENYAQEYALADSLISRNKISPEYLPYLFKPGDSLVSHKGGEHRGFVATSWPNISFQKYVSRRQAALAHSGTNVSAYALEDANTSMRADRVKIYVCRVQVWHWAFDGNFQRENENLDLELPENEGFQDSSDMKGKITSQQRSETSKAGITELEISELNIFPIRFASAEITEKLRQRGRTFWRCRNSSYVSYRGTAEDSFQNSVGHFLFLWSKMILTETIS